MKLKSVAAKAGGKAEVRPELSDAATELSARIRAIKEGYQSRAGASRRSDYESRAGYVKREVYQLARSLFRQKRSEEAVLRAIEELRVAQGEAFKPKDNMFSGLLHLLFEHHELSRGEKQRYVNELEYARMHAIPVGLLIGFILQLPPDRDLANRVENKEYEPWFRKGKHLDWKANSDTGSDQLKEAEKQSRPLCRSR